jgi:hypothetical protein
MSEIKEEEKRPLSSSAPPPSADGSSNANEVATITSLATLNLLHKQVPPQGLRPPLLIASPANTIVDATAGVYQPIYIPFLKA